MLNSANGHQFEVPPVPTNKRRITFSFGASDIEFFKCFPSSDFLGARYDSNPAQLLIVWDIFVSKYHCELKIFSPSNQLLLSVPVPKSINLPYTIIDGVLTEWVTKEEFVYFQFVFTSSGEFVKSTLPIRMNFSEANRPDYLKVIKPTEFERMKELSDTAVVNAILHFDEAKGWEYRFYSKDGTQLFSLAWIPSTVIQGTEQVLTVNEKMIARANIGVPFTFVLPFSADDGTLITRSTATYINKLEHATIEVWRDNGDETFTAVAPLSLSYGSDYVSAELPTAINGYLRVSCKSSRFIPSGDNNLAISPFSDNLLMNEDSFNIAVEGKQDE